MTEPVKGANLIVTGIPRSGTSYVCSLLNNIENTVIINEPEEIFENLHNESSSNLKSYYDYIRYCIGSRIPIKNKIVNGKYIEDTNKDDVRSFYIPEVNDADFVLGTKNTLVYLASLHKIDRQLPGVRIVVFIRHPFDCISSWKKVKFPHIRNANPLFLKDYVEAEDAGEIIRICSHPELETRYALLWNFLAMRIMDYRDELVLYRYEDFVTQPVHYLSELYHSMGKDMQLKSPVAASQARRHRDGLSTLEQDRMHEYCSISARHFGYDL